MNYKMITALLLFSIFTLSLLTTVFIGSKGVLEKSPKIQNSIKLIKNKIQKDDSITILATGDVMLGRYVNAVTVKSNDFTLPFQKTADLLNSADITIINFEGTLIKNCPIVPDKTLIFCGDPNHTEGLNFAGVDIVNLANNHAYNYGANGLTQTIKFLENSGIKTTGLNSPTYLKANNKKIAFLGFNQVPPFPEELGLASEENVRSQVSNAKQNADLVVVSFHWGNEYTETVTEIQKSLARTAIDNGADLVIGHHPHWTQKTEIYKNKLILYSLGNFIFDQDWSEKTQLGEVAKVTFKDNKISNYQLIPIKIEKNFQPKVIQ